MNRNPRDTGKNKRCFIRHPVTLPVKCQKEGHQEANAYEMRDISFGGMSFVSIDFYAPGDLVAMEFPVQSARRRVDGEIIWSARLKDQPTSLYANGLKFLTRQMLFIARIVEQLCCIEKYREAQALQFSRSLSGDQAAQEWIRLCAARFPNA